MSVTLSAGVQRSTLSRTNGTLFLWFSIHVCIKHAMYVSCLSKKKIPCKNSWCNCVFTCKKLKHCLITATMQNIFSDVVCAASCENRIFAYAKTKTQISFAVTAKLISAFVFATRIVQSLYFLNPKFQASSHLLWLCRLVCVGPGRKPRRPVFSERGSYGPCHEKTCLLSFQPGLTQTGLNNQRKWIEA